MDINSKTIDEFRADFNAAIAPLQEKYGVTITLGHITYYEEYFSSRLKVVNGTDPETTAMINFDADVWKFEHLGLQPGMYKRIFKGVDGEMYFRLQPPRAQVSNHHFTRIRRRGESLF